MCTSTGSQISNDIADVCFITDHVAYASSNKTNIVWIETKLFSFFTRGGCASCLRACLGARLLLQSYQYPNSKHWFTTSSLQLFFYFFTPGGCFCCHDSTQTFRTALTASLDSCAETKSALLTKSGRVWRKVPESGARSVGLSQTPSTGFRHPSFNHCRI